jgi:hypothetical protein
MDEMVAAESTKWSQVRSHGQGLDIDEYDQK